MTNIIIYTVDDSVHNEDWYGELSNVDDNIQEFTEKTQDAIDNLINQLDHICDANTAGKQAASGEASTNEHAAPGETSA